MDYHKNEEGRCEQDRKARFLEWYKDIGLGQEDSLDIKLDKEKGTSINSLREYPVDYPEENERSPMAFYNRMCFWMATGSGKSLVSLNYSNLDTVDRKR